MRLRLRAYLVVGALLLGALYARADAARVIEGEVVAVHDGDTISVLVDEREVRVRLAAIDTPERGQPWSQRSRQALVERVFRKQVRVIAVTVDRYGRTVGEVYADDVCVGCELVRDGHAWVYRRFSDDPVLLDLEEEARVARRGLWALPEADRTPPWEWRDARGAGRTPPTSDARPKAQLVCGAKRYCAEMSSCEEARFHHGECGLARLDGDGDGVPCEALCARR